MLRTMILIGALGGLIAFIPAHAALKEATPETRRQQVQKNQQERLQAIARRGRLGSFQQLLGTGRARVASSASASDAVTRDAAIDLAALGFTAADVKAYRGYQIDLFDVAHRLFEGFTSPTEQMLMADTIVTGTAGQTQDSRKRVDGFLAEVPFTVAESLQGPRAAGDIVRIPLSSGPTSNGSYQRDFSEVQFVRGKKYLLVLSKNWYEQFVALHKKQTESGFTALPFVVYEVVGNDTLRRVSRALKPGGDPENVESVKAKLKRLVPNNSQRSGAR